MTGVLVRSEERHKEDTCAYNVKSRGEGYIAANQEASRAAGNSRK